MSDGLDRIVAQKKCDFSNSIKVTQKTVLFSYSIKLYLYWGNLQSSYEKTSFMEKIMKIILEEMIMLDRHMSYGLMYSFLQLFCNTEKIRLNWRLDSTATDYVLLIFIVIPHWLIMNLLKNMSIRHKIRNHAAPVSIVFPFDVKFFFLAEDTEK